MKTKIFTVFALFLLILSERICGQCSEFLAVSSSGARYGNGTFYTVDLKGTLLSSWEVPSINEGFSPVGSLVQASNGKFYGVTTSGGTFSKGLIYEWDAVTNVYVKKLDFDGIATGSESVSLYEGTEGYFSGITATGGQNNLGVLFKWNPLTNDFIKILDFDGRNYGSNPAKGLLHASNGLFYGITSTGGKFGKGVLYEWNPLTNEVKKKVDFNGTNGDRPVQIIEANDSLLYGLTLLGGSYSAGTLFSYSIEKDTLITKYNFGLNSDGETPLCLFYAGNGKIYGTTKAGAVPCGYPSHGGEYCIGVFFEWDPDSSKYIKISNLAINEIYDWLYERNNRLYGYGSYTRYLSYDLNSKQLKFRSLNGTFKASGFTVGTDGKSYGLINTYQGLSYLSEMINDSVFDNKLQFNFPVNGRNLHYSLLNYGNGNHYGVALSGGIHNSGVLFEWDENTKNYTKLYDFNGTSDGREPKGPLLKTGSGKILGTTNQGGTNNFGILFEWDPEKKEFSKILDFTSNIQSPDQLERIENGRIFLIRYGQYICEYDTINKVLNLVRSTSYIEPIGSISFFNGKGYGISSPYDNSVLFCWNPETNSYKTLFHINSGSYGFLYPAQSGIFYFYDYKDGSFEFNAVKNTLVKTDRLPDYPDHGLKIASDGKFYVITWNKDFYKWDPDLKQRWITPIGTDLGSSLILNEIIPDVVADTVSEVACEPYMVPGTDYVYYKSGKYRLCLRNKTGSDSTVILDLSIKNRTYSSITEYVCGGDWTSPSGKYTMKDPGSSFTDTIPNYQGCDSVISITRLSENQRHSYQIMACDYYDSPSGKYKWTTSGIHYDTIPAPNECLDILQIYLVLGHTTNTTTDTIVCDKFMSASGKIREESGIYYDTVPNSSGCYNIITTHLIVNHKSFRQLSLEGCDSIMSPSGKYVWKYSGVYQDTIQSSCGCDSILLIDADIFNINPSVVTFGSSLQAAASGLSYQWLEYNNEEYSLIEGATNQSYTPRFTGNYAVIISKHGCADTSQVFPVIITEINESAKNEIKLYPNPTNGKVTIDLGKIYDESTVTVMNSTGIIVQEIKVKNTQKAELNLNEPGMYLVKVRSGDVETIKRVIKQ
jgi:hypothetical protein